MNDISEVGYGLHCLRYAYNHEESGRRFRNALEAVAPDLTKEIEQSVNGWTPWFFEDTYLTCLSAHDEKKEGRIGRLSMWRAYGRAAGVALVINTVPFYSTLAAFGAATSPVAYEDPVSFRLLFDEIAQGIEKHSEPLRKVTRQTLHDYVFNAFRFAALCTKHPGFIEELEWRIVYSPKIFESPYIGTAIETIDGIPQRVHKIKLQNVPAIGLVGAEIPQLLDRLIIGPSQYSSASRDAFVELLKKEGVADAETRVIESRIPLRQ